MIKRIESQVLIWVIQVSAYLCCCNYACSFFLLKELHIYISLRLRLNMCLHFKVYYKLDFREKKKKEENKDRPTQKPKQHCKVINNKVWYNFVLGVVKFEYYFGILGLMQGQKRFSPSVFGGPVLIIFLLFVFCLSPTCVLCAQCYQYLWIVLLFIALSGFSSVYIL
jgi:hypothetical protein